MGRKNGRRPRLTPIWLPYIRDRLARDARQALRGADASAYERILDEAWDAADALASAPIWWVSRDMAALAVEAARDGGLPEVDVPSPTGLVVFEGGLPAEYRADFPARGHGEVSIDAIQWRAHAADGERLPTGVLPYTSDPGCVRDYDPGIPLAPFLFESHGGLPPRWGMLLRAIWALSAQPRVCRVSLPCPAPSDRLPARYEPEVRKVKMLVLRENLHGAGGGPGEGGDGRRGYSHRFIVRGFWRDQAYGPGHSLRRRQWIPPYVKGPADKPLIVKETVRVWRR